MKHIYNWILSFLFEKQKRFKWEIVSELPEKPDEYILYIEGNFKEEDFWYASLKCPCDCGDIIMLNLMTDTKPSWNVNIENKNPSVYPSIWRTKNCKSHFWIKDGKLVWA
ncbi:MAG: DUF6527 family protein [Maribacter dokdonensis]|uniref:DUF6527 family protein n=1 Tax=Maribacter dokdonensis TaxID=320912 RepID=UPI0032662B3C